jgi:putative mRNA 3-end processing factor
MSELLVSNESGLYCPVGDFYIDPWRPVPRAIITHAHIDHATPGSERYLTSQQGLGLLRARLGSDVPIDALDYGEPLEVNGVRLTLHPAGHILGSAQVRIEHKGEVWVVTGDYKLARDPTCRPFELQRCDTLITESTFGLPIYRWHPVNSIFEDMNCWWQANASAGQCSVIFAYSLGKAQRVLSGLDPELGPIYCHGAVERMNAVYRASGVTLPETVYTGMVEKRHDWAGAIVLAPASARGSPWIRRFGDCSTAFASGWMQIRGARRRRSVDRGFALSDHADWPTLLDVIKTSGASRILVTHGFVDPLVGWLLEHGWNAAPLHTEFRGELDETAEPAEASQDILAVIPQAADPGDNGTSS